MSRDILLQVRELLSRNLDVFEISNRLNIDLDTARLAVNIINNLLT